MRLANGRRREEKQTGQGRRRGIAGEKERTERRRTRGRKEGGGGEKERKGRENEGGGMLRGVSNDKREREGAEGERGGKSSSKGPPRGPEGLVRRRKPQ